MSKQVKKGPAFLLKIYDMIQNQKFKQVIAWNDQGIGFFINDAEKMSTQVLPVYFKHSNMHSFIRQLNMYGFNKTRGKKSDNYYFHPLFRRGSKNLIYQMQRKVQKKGSKKQCLNINNQNISIQIQPSEQNNKENNINLQKKMPTSMTLTNSNIMLQNQIRQKMISLLNINRCLMVQQFCHLNQVGRLNSSIIQEQELGNESLKVNNQFITQANHYFRANMLLWESVRIALDKNFSRKQINSTELTISNRNHNTIDINETTSAKEGQQNGQNSINLQMQSESKIQSQQQQKYQKQISGNQKMNQ